MTTRGLRAWRAMLFSERHSKGGHNMRRAISAERVIHVLAVRASASPAVTWIRDHAPALPGLTPRRDRRISTYDIAAIVALVDAVLLILIGSGLARTLDGDAAPHDWQIWAMWEAVSLHFLLAQNFSAYSPNSVLDRKHALSQLPLPLLATFAFMLTAVVALKVAESYSRMWFFSWAALSILAIVLARLIAQKFYRRALRNGCYVFKGLSVGVACEAVRASEIETYTSNKVHVPRSLRLSTTGDLVPLSEVIARDEIDQVYIAAQWEQIPRVMKELKPLRRLASAVFVVPADRNEISIKMVGATYLGDRILFRAIEKPIAGWDQWLKRKEDVCIALVGGLALLPLFVFIAIAIRLDSPGPVFFRQTRVGFNGRTFKLWKFRSMFTDRTDHHAKVQTMKGDPRVTRVGRFIRSTSLDELPQLLNVLDGSMSIVGPRPHALSTRAEGRKLEELVEFYGVRHRMKPGITGWAQIHGYRGELDNVDKLRNRVAYDLEYINRWSIWLDMWIIIKTVLLVFRDPNAY